MVRKTRRQKKQKGGSKKEIRAYPGPSQCHPRVGRETPKGGCLPLEVLEKGFVGQQGAGTMSSDERIKAVGKHLGVDPQKQRSLLNKLPLTSQEKEE